MKQFILKLGVFFYYSKLWLWQRSYTNKTDSHMNVNNNANSTASATTGTIAGKSATTMLFNVSAFSKHTKTIDIVFLSMIDYLNDKMIILQSLG